MENGKWHENAIYDDEEGLEEQPQDRIHGEWSSFGGAHLSNAYSTRRSMAKYKHFSINMYHSRKSLPVCDRFRKLSQCDCLGCLS